MLNKCCSEVLSSSEFALLFEEGHSTDFSRKGNGPNGLMNWDKWITKPNLDLTYCSMPAAHVDTSGINLARQNPVALLIFIYFNIDAASAKKMVSLTEFQWLKKSVCLQSQCKDKFIDL